MKSLEIEKKKVPGGEIFLVRVAGISLLFKKLADAEYFVKKIRYAEFEAQFLHFVEELTAAQIVAANKNACEFSKISLLAAQMNMDYGAARARYYLQQWFTSQLAPSFPSPGM